MVTETGKNLSVLIFTKPEMDWQTFSTWYSFKQNAPDCNIAIFCERNESVPFLYYQWTKRLRIKTIKQKFFYSNNFEDLNILWAADIFLKKEILNIPLLVIKPYVVLNNIFNKKILSLFQKNIIYKEEKIYFINKNNLKEKINDFYLKENELWQKEENTYCLEAKENEDSWPLISFEKGCGRWINTAKGCPFSNAAGLVSQEMNINEKKIIELWKKMVPLYQATI